MKKLLLTISFFLICFNPTVFAVSLTSDSTSISFNKKLSFSSSFTYIWNNTDDIYENDFYFHNKLLFYLNSSVGIGINSSIIKSFVTDYDVKTFYLVGPVVQLKPTKNKKSLSYVELGFFKGNFCVCNDYFYPYVKNDLSYLYMGGGMNYRLLKTLYIDLGLSKTFILNDPNGESIFNYKIGLEYYFGFKKNKLQRSGNVRDL